MKIGDLVKPKPGTVEGDPETLGIGIVTSVEVDDWDNDVCRVSWSKTQGQPWFMYEKDLIQISKNVKKL